MSAETISDCLAGLLEQLAAKDAEIGSWKALALEAEALRKEDQLQATKALDEIDRLREALGDVLDAIKRGDGLAVIKLYADEALEKAAWRP